MSKVLLATQKPFSIDAKNQIEKIIHTGGHDLIALESYDNQEILKKQIKDVEVLIVRSDSISEEVINSAPKLKIIVRAGTGVDNIDVDACTKRGVIVMNTPGQNSNAVAELVLGLMIYGARNMFKPGTGAEIRGRKLGLKGYGNIARLVARLAKAHGMQVSTYDPYAPKNDILADGVEIKASAEDLFETNDFVSLHIPATPQTIGLIDYGLMSRLPSNGTLINTARAEIINESDIEKLLEKRPDITYLSDIKPTHHEKLTNKFPTQVFFTPKKMGAETAEANIGAGITAAQQAVDFLNSGQIIYRVN